jgi:hypothetical protein
VSEKQGESVGLHLHQELSSEMDKECLIEPTLALAIHKGRKDEHHFQCDHKLNNVDLYEKSIYLQVQLWQVLFG